MSLETIVKTCLRRGISCIALTDHDSLAAVQDLQRVAPFTVIAGEEIKTSRGEIIGLFLTNEIPRGMDPRATAEEIRRQGGVVYVPHPFDRFRRSRLSAPALASILDLVDVIETYNSRITLLRDVVAAERFALEHGKLRGAGSDAHVWWELGQSYVEMPEFENGREGFLGSLAQGRVHGKLSWPMVHIASSIARLRKRRRKP